MPIWRDHGLGNRGNTFDGNKWREKKIMQYTLAAIQQKNDVFVQEHQADTDEQLIEYLWVCAKAIGHTPCKVEVLGGDMIAERFGSWEDALTAAQLPKPWNGVKLQHAKIYYRELRHQTRSFKQTYAAEQEARRQASRARSMEAQKEKAARLERDAQWGAEHESLTNEELLSYLHDCAESLGHAPYSYEVVGGRYISERLGSWAMALYQAGLPEVKGVKLRDDEKKMLRREQVRKSEAKTAPE